MGEISEDRVARWCRRLWEITRQSADPAQPTRPLPRPNALHEAQLKQMDKTAAAAAHIKSAAAAAPSREGVSRTTADGYQKTSLSASEADAESMEVDALLTRLQNSIRGDGGRIPGVILEDVWAVFDQLVPPAIQDDVSAATITPDIEEKFFAFVSTLNELDFDLQAVVNASKDLEGKLDQYLTLLRQREKDEKQLAASRQTTPATDGVTETAEVTERLTRAKGEVMRCCFQARNVGAPLYYTWLRHTASLADGLRRLMHFRKVAHYFETLCKKRVRACGAELNAPNLFPEAQEDLARQQVTWQRRQIEVGLIDGALSLLFHDFFAKEHLVMEELTWYTTPPSLLDQIMRAEGVHPFERGLDDMRYRLQPARHRHLFAFLHPAVVEEPLIAVQVALTHGIASSVDRILGRPTPLADPDNHTKAAELFRQLAASESSSSEARVDGDVNTAIFYSINSAQSALRGMDMGNRLIKRVVKEVEGNINAARQGHHLTPIHTFSTLSPIPLYVKWLAGAVAAMATQTTAQADTISSIFGAQLTPEEAERLYFAPLREAVAGYILRHPSVLPQEAQAVVAASSVAVTLAKEDGAVQPHEGRRAANVAVLRYLVRLFQTSPATVPASSMSSAGFEGRWWGDHVFTEALEAPLLRSVAIYLATVKRPGANRMRDPVGNFHVSNGATVYRLNFLGNTTEQGSRESACVMVNYWYDMPTVSTNVTTYEVSQHVALGEPIMALLGSEVL